MNTDNAPLVNKLILLVLSLILVCLVLIVVSGYTERKLGTRGTAVSQAASPVDEPAETMVENATSRPVRQPVTNRVRSAGGDLTSNRSNSGRPAALQPSEPPDSGKIAVQDFTAVGFGFAPGVSEAEGAATGTNAAEVFGVATLLGMPKPEIPIDLGPGCGRLNRTRPTTRHYVVNSAGQLANVFVYISQGITDRFATPRKPVLLDQVGCLFQPYVFALQTGQTLQVRNSDPEFHNLHITPRLNPERNIAQSHKGQINDFTFQKAELFIRIKCDVHPWMFAYGCVVEHPFFSITDTNGAFRLPPGLRAGRYTLTASHLKAGTLAQEFEFRPGEPRAFAFQFVVPEATQAQSENVEALKR